MKSGLLRTLMILTLAFLAGCTASSTPTTPLTATPIPPTSTLLPATETPVSKATLAATRIPPTPFPIPPTPIPLPATDTVCASGCDFTTIQAAIDDASTEGGAIIEITDPIHTEAGIVVNKNVTIRGLGAVDTIVQAHDQTPDEAPERVFLVGDGSTVILESLTIRHGRPSRQEECGGGIMNQGTLTLKNCVVSDNVSNSGAGICNRGVLTLINSTISDNTADGVGPVGYTCGNGGGIKCERGTLTLINSTIRGNKSEDADPFRDMGYGGGVHVGCNCAAVFTNSTISGNRAAAVAGGIYIKGTLRLVNSTISDNRAFGEGGGVYVRGHLDYLNTIIAGNTGKGGNCVVGGPGGYRGEGSIGINSHNLVEDGSCDSTYSGNPMLGLLADNGGSTLTHALLPSSPAIDAIPAISCTLPTDQRGAIRPIVQTSADTPCDIGAFEWQATTLDDIPSLSIPSSEMVRIPAGEFIMGSDEGRSDERPVHTVYLDAYYIDKTEVTNAQFAQFLNEQGNQEEDGETWLDIEDEDCLITESGGHYRPKSEYKDHPVIEATWYGAKAYCNWRGLSVQEQIRLPTEAEWEKAASWNPAMDAKRIYPWGNEWDDSRANADRPITTTTEIGVHTVSVGSNPKGASSYGVLNMAGNVWEWVADWYARDYYGNSPSQNPQGPDAGEDKVVRGGSWRSPSSFARTTVRHHWFPAYTFDIGFRCAYSP
ncbi:MAG: SUMF1/EgtB/PvdO family nonheme iron enzyme [Anaerolineales bacterium]